MNQNRFAIFSIFFGVIVVGSFIFGFVLQKQLNSNSTFFVSTENRNANLAATLEIDPWWWGIGTFQKQQFRVTACNLVLEIPKRWYMQKQSYDSGNNGAMAINDARTCFTQFGDDGTYWSIQVVSRPNLKKLSLSEWGNQQMQYDVPFEPKKFGIIDALYLQRNPTDIIEESYIEIAVVATDAWVHTIQYLDKDSGRPRSTEFAKLVASVRAYTGEPAEPEPKYMATTRKSVSATADLYTNGVVRFSMEIPHAWSVRTATESTVDVQYGDTVSIESSARPLFWSSGKGPDHESQVSTSGIAVRVSREPYYNAKFTDYLDTHYQKGKYQTKTVIIGKDIRATQVWSYEYYQVYNQEYVFVSGDYVYTIGVRQENTKDDATVNAMLKSLKVL